MAALLALLFAAVCNARVFSGPDQVPRLDAYDYVIVGGGVAGSVVANRLTEDRSVSVLLLEAGPSHHALPIEVPFLKDTTNTGSIYDWNYSTVPQAALDNRVLAAPRGHVLGGSSSTNGMVYTRGSSADFDRWAAVTRDNGWLWDNMQPYFKKSETHTPPVDHHNTTGQFDPALYGNKGPLSVTLGGFTQATDALVMSEVGNNSPFPFIEDYNDGSPVGFGWLQLTILNGARSSAATAFLDTVAQRPNLDIVINTRALRLVYSKSAKIPAIELQREGGGIILRAQAKKEVILSGGSVGTPHLLLNSGIGDKHQLLALNITPVHHLPSVGKNLTDQPAVTNTWNTKHPDNVNVNAAFTSALAQWNATHTGRLSMGSCNTVGWLRLNESDPAVQSLFATQGDPAPGPHSPHIEFLPILNAADAVDNFADAVFSLATVALAIKSRGSLSLNPADRFGPPLIDYNFYSAPGDIEVMRQAIRTAITFVSTPQWQNFLGAPNTSSLAAVVDVMQRGVDDGNAAIDAHIRATTLFAYHIIGTAAMSPKGAEWGVVDPDFRVKGLSGLRVIDSSIMPFVPSAHTQAPTYAIAERAADIVKGKRTPEYF